MTPQDLQRTAYTVECFLNALRLEDGSERTEVEEALVHWLLSAARQEDDHLIYQDSTITCYSQQRATQSFLVSQARQTQTIWCNAHKISLVDSTALSTQGKLVMLGTGGLAFTMPGILMAEEEKNKKRSSNNNNNNNNNNNG